MTLPTLNTDDPAEALSKMALDNETKLTRLVDISQEMLEVLIRDFREQKKENEEDDHIPDYDVREYIRRNQDREDAKAAMNADGGDSATNGMFAKMLKASKAGGGKFAGMAGNLGGRLLGMTRIPALAGAAPPVAIGVGVGAIAFGLFSFIWPWIRKYVEPVILKVGEVADKFYQFLTNPVNEMGAGGPPRGLSTQGSFSASLLKFLTSGSNKQSMKGGNINNTTINNISGGGSSGTGVAILSPISGHVPRPSAFAIQA